MQFWFISEDGHLDIPRGGPHKITVA